VESYRTEEEQVEALQKWWQENSKSTIAAIVFALAAGYGWQGWQQHRVEQAENASAIYQDLLEAVNISTASALNEEQAITARHLANSLKSDFSSTSYAQFAALQLAKLAVNDGDLEAAEAELRWVLTQNPADEVHKVAQLRLARVVASGGNAQGGLDMLAINAGAFEAVYAEARGDIYIQMQQPQQALSAYQEAASHNQLNGAANTPALDLKLQSLQLQQPRATLVTAPAPTQSEQADAED
jgi:predicted negative regulator of RcsB-dependent stress response